MQQSPLLLFAFCVLTTPGFAQQNMGRRLPVRVALPAELAPGDWGESFELLLEGAQRDGQPVWLQLSRASVRAPGFQLLTWDVKDGYLEIPAPPVKSYFGEVLGFPGTTVFASMDSSGLHARIDWSSGDMWQVDPSGEQGSTRGARWHDLELDGKDTTFERYVCGSDVDALVLDVAGKVPPGSEVSSSGPGGGTLVGPGQVSRPGTQAPAGGFDSAPACMTKAEIAFDADFEYYVLKNSSVADTLSAVEGILAQVNYYFARDVSIQHELTQLVVRTSLFYTPTSGGDLLNQFRTEWNTNLIGIPRDMAHLMTNKSGIQYAGLAWVTAVCTSYSYGWSLDSANVVGHELGHNWASGHCNDLAPCNNMCGGCFYIAPITKDIIEAYRDTRPCLEQAPAFALPVPPYAYPESLAMDMSRLQSEGPFLFDVLANDEDSNCQSVSLQGFDSVTARGATLFRAAGAGAAGRDAIWYFPPSVPFVGDDVFTYEVTDPGGLFALGTVTVTSSEERMRAYWPFDDGAGVLIEDVTGQGNDGLSAFEGPWVPGASGGALRLSGNGQQILVPAVPSAGDWTYAAWVRRLPGSPVVAALMECSNGSLRLEQWANTGLLGVTRFGVQDATYPFSAPLNQWSHLAFSGSQGLTNLYVDGVYKGSVPLEVAAPMGNMGSGGSLIAEIDEVRVYDFAMKPSAIGELAQGGGHAQNPTPGFGGQTVFDPVELAWIGHPQAARQRVYLGTDYALVQAATIASPEYLGETMVWDWNVSGLTRGQTYYWRVDEVLSGNAYGGETWAFEFARALHWSLDDVAGPLALESFENHHGSYFGGILLAQPGATPVLGNSVWMDGINDRVRIPAPELNSNRATFTAWIRRSGQQNDWSGLIFSRAGNTAAGLNFGYNNELRYHWNGGHWGFDSGLVVPDDEWVFVALSISPTEARLYLGQAGVLSSVTNGSTHVPEEFDGYLFLGRDPLYSSRRFRGYMDDVNFFRATLSEEDIARVYADSQ